MKKFFVALCFVAIGCGDKAPTQVQEVKEVTTNSVSTDTQVNYDTELMRDLQELIKDLEEVHKKNN